MKGKFLFILIATLRFVVPPMLAYQIPKLTFERLPDGFRISIPDEPGIQAVLYAVDINEQCPALFDYIKSPEQQFWTMTRKELIKNGDRLAISALVQNGEELYNRNEIFEIGQMNYAFALSPDMGSNTLNSFDQCELKRYCKESETTVNGTSVCSGSVIFEEDFKDLPTLNPKNWDYDISIRLNGDGDEEFVMFSKDVATIYIKDGHLYIKPIVVKNSIQKGSINLSNEGKRSAYGIFSLKKPQMTIKSANLAVLIIILAYNTNKT